MGLEDALGDVDQVRCSGICTAIVRKNECEGPESMHLHVNSLYLRLGPWKIHREKTHRLLVNGDDTGIQTKKKTISLSHHT